MKKGAGKLAVSWRPSGTIPSMTEIYLTPPTQSSNLFQHTMWRRSPIRDPICGDSGGVVAVFAYFQWFLPSPWTDIHEAKAGFLWSVKSVSIDHLTMNEQSGRSSSDISTVLGSEFPWQLTTSICRLPWVDYAQRLPLPSRIILSEWLGQWIWGNGECGARGEVVSGSLPRILETYIECDTAIILRLDVCAGHPNIGPELLLVRTPIVVGRPPRENQRQRRDERSDTRNCRTHDLGPSLDFARPIRQRCCCFDHGTHYASTLPDPQLRNHPDQKCTKCIGFAYSRISANFDGSRRYPPHFSSWPRCPNTLELSDPRFFPRYIFTDNRGRFVVVVLVDDLVGHVNVISLLRKVYSAGPVIGCVAISSKPHPNGTVIRIRCFQIILAKILGARLMAASPDFIEMKDSPIFSEA